ncbi:hypothetical protein PAXINDRAFT_95698 [Paxillus involutus ATCC 200175]|nr:hypothetical protein PAXINDRAFT_95698 [Paxillus involutus ATCC 200175]
MTDSISLVPFEILQIIFCHLDVLDILRIRRVSRYLNGISHSRDIWSDAYRRAEFIRPPGPFLFQTAEELERSLVASFKVDRTFGQGNVRREKSALKSREIRYTGIDLHVSLVFGRFLVIVLSEEVRCYDLNVDAFDSNSGASIIYRPSGALMSFHCLSAIDKDGRPFACAVANEGTGSSSQRTTQITICSLKVEGAEVSLEPIHQFKNKDFDIQTLELGPGVLVIQGKMDPDSDDRCLVAFDIHTRTQLKLPPLTRTQWQTAESTNAEEFTETTGFSTSTHLILSTSFYSPMTGWCTHLEAFAIPPPTQLQHLPDSSSLSLSHSGFIPAITLNQGVLLHDSIVDPATGDVLIKIRAHSFEPDRPRNSISSYGTLRLHNTHSTQSVGTIEFHNLGPFGQLARTPFLHPSLNGKGRTFYTVEPGIYNKVSALEWDVSDESQAKVVEYPSILRFPSTRTLLDYDQYQGRLCLRYMMPKYRIIEILDFAI